MEASLLPSLSNPSPSSEDFPLYSPTSTPSSSPLPRLPPPLLTSPPPNTPQPLKIPPLSLPNASSPHGASPRSLLASLSTLERALIGGAAGGIAGAFTYVCLLPIDADKTKLQTHGIARLYSSAVDAALHIFRSEGIFGFYRGVSAVLIGSASSCAVYFGTCELGKSLLSKIPPFPPLGSLKDRSGAGGGGGSFGGGSLEGLFEFLGEISSCFT